MKTKIQNIDDLSSEILRLRLKRVEQENDLQFESKRIAARFRFPIIMLTKLNDWFGVFNGNEDEDNHKKGQHDWVTNAFRIGLPVFMNKFIFPKSGFIMKSLVELLSQKAAKTLNKDMLTDLIDKVSDWISTSKNGKRKAKVLPDYGIPPDSETY